MIRIVISIGYRSFGLSEKARTELEELGVIVDEYGDYASGKSIRRDDPRLVAIVEKLGGIAAKNDGDDDHLLKIVEIPEDVDWEIKNYDGSEWVAEKHRTWR